MLNRMLAILMYKQRMLSLTTWAYGPTTKVGGSRSPKMIYWHEKFFYKLAAPT